MRALAWIVAAALAASCSGPPPAIATPTPTAEHGVLAITALLDLSGPRAAIGTAQRDALQLWQDQQGATRFPVKVRTVDVAGSDAKLLVELRAAAVDAAADAVIVGAPIAFDDTLGRAVDTAALPVLFTLPIGSDPAARPGGGWAFALAPSLERLASVEVDDAMRRGTLTPSLVLTDPRDRIDPMASALETDLAGRRLAPLTRVAMPADGSVPPVVRSSLSVLRSVHCTALVSSCTAVAQAAQAGSTPTFFYLSYLAATRDVSDHRELASRAIWPTSRRILPFDAPPVTPENRARAAFLRAFGDRYGVPGVHAAAAYDALSLLRAAADRAGPDDRAALRGALEKITMPLIATTYSFAPDRHAGSDPDDVTYVRWAGSRIAPALAPSLGTGLATPTPSPSPTARVTPTASPTASPRP